MKFSTRFFAVVLTVIADDAVQAGLDLIQDGFGFLSSDHFSLIGGFVFDGALDPVQLADQGNHRSGSSTTCLMRFLCLVLLPGTGSPPAPDHRLIQQTTPVDPHVRLLGILPAGIIEYL